MKLEQVKDSRFRGRNGWAKMDSFWIEREGDGFWIGFYSKRSGNCAPVVLLMSREDLDNLQGAIREAMVGAEVATRARAGKGGKK